MAEELPAAERRRRLHALLGGEALAPLRRRLRQVYARAASGEDPAQVRLGELNDAEAELLQSLAGQAPRPVRSLGVDLAALGRQLRDAGLADGLRDALEELDGPIVDRDARERVAAAWSALAASPTHGLLQAWLSQPRSLGLLKRLAAGDPARAEWLCRRAAAVLAALPAPGQPRARLAARCLGDAHALDDGEPVATLVLAALRRSVDGADAEGSRALWATQGVAVNELARPALVLNLPRDGADAADGEPRFWSLRALLRSPPAWQVLGREVFVCENPNLLALAADALGARCAPLVCTDGMPAAAQRTLLRQLAGAGARLHYHGDFDWSGLAIGNQMLQALGAQAWRFGSGDYRAALESQGQVRAALEGQPVAASWDAALAPAMADAGCAVAEEAVFDTLRADLQR